MLYVETVTVNEVISNLLLKRLGRFRDLWSCAIVMVNTGPLQRAMDVSNSFSGCMVSL